MNRLIYRIIINTIAFILAALLLPVKAATPLHFIGAGIVLSLINMLVKPVLIILTIPLNLLTLGIFTIVINTWMIMLTSGLVPGFYVPGFGVALLVSIIVSLANIGFKKMIRG